MEWLTTIRKSIEYIETHLTENITPEHLANQVNISPYMLSNGFSVMTGYSISEYIRGRRLYLAAIALQETSHSILDIALDFGYDTPESFTKAFTRFHGSTPSSVRNGAAFQIFLPLKLQITIQGGNQMDCKIKKMCGLKLIGFQKEFSTENSYEEIPKYWDELSTKYLSNVYAGTPPANPYEKAVMDHCIGEYAVCIDDIGAQTFRYLVAGKYTGGEIPEGMVLYEFPMGDWAVFDCIGPLPESLQSVNTKIFKEWLPGNAEFELCGNATVEWYDPMGDTDAADYCSAIWIPVKRK